MTSTLSQKKRVSNGTNSNAIIWISKNIFSIFFCISEIYIKFGILSKRRWASEIICFQNYRLSLKLLTEKSRVTLLPKKPCVRTLIHSQHIKGSKKLVKSAWQNFCHIFWSFRKKISLKNSVLGVSKILRLFVNGTTSNAIISKSRNMLWIFSCISEIYIKFEKLWTRRWSSEVICFRKL